jgi:hypothetical protein
VFGCSAARRSAAVRPAPARNERFILRPGRPAFRGGRLAGFGIGGD